MDYSNRISANEIMELKDDEIFVFGSNLAGIHEAGAAYIAHHIFDAIYREGKGRQGNTYAIPTKDYNIQTLKLSVIEGYTQEFIQHALFCYSKKFLVTEIGCGLAGYTPEQIAPLFINAIPYSNIHLPERFWKILIK